MTLEEQLAMWILEGIIAAAFILFTVLPWHDMRRDKR